MVSTNQDKITALIEAIARWSAKRCEITAVALVGSRARGDFREDSDVDFVILTDDPADFRRKTEWADEIGLGVGISRWEDKDYGAVWSRHLYLQNGAVLEVCFGTPSWAKTDPIDPGTLGVTKGGFRILFDPRNILGQLAAAVNRTLLQPVEAGEEIQYYPVDEKDEELIGAASKAIGDNYRDPRHTVGAAVRCSSGKIHIGVNVESCGYGPCAEPVAVGQAITSGDGDMQAIVAVAGPNGAQYIIPPCGNCRQLIFDYAPNCWVIISRNGKTVKARAAALLPDAYCNFQ